VLLLADASIAKKQHHVNNATDGIFRCIHATGALMSKIDRHLPFAMTIAGSDSGGGAGIQADLRAFASQGVFGLSAITAVTAQNSRAVSAVRSLSVAMVAAQIEMLMGDFPVAAVKTGMLANVAITRQVARFAARYSAIPWVIDPVMIASSGARLLDSRAQTVLIRELLPMASVLTPNLPEAEAILGERIETESDVVAAARALLALGPRAVLLKGGHLPGSTVCDVLCYDDQTHLFRAPRRNIRGHGTGCTLASLIAARLALKDAMPQAINIAIGEFRIALAHGVVIGQDQVWVPYPVPIAVKASA